jgi:Ni,Fe-hydrogenase maturation factor
LSHLAPEVANDIAAYDTVVFLDADSDVKELRIQSVDEEESPMPDSRTSRPAEIVALAREASSFAGRAFVCRIPATDVSAGEGLSRRAKISARRAAAALEGLLREMRAAIPSSQPQILRAGN